MDSLHYSLKVETFKEDAFALQPFCKALEDYLFVDHDFVEGSLVASLNGSFGTGKTTFLKMWENDLLERKKSNPSSPLVINLNAWDGDYCGEPLLAIVTSILETIDRNVDEPESDEKKALKDAIKDVAWFTLGLGNGLVKGFTQIDALEAAKLAETKKKERMDVGGDLLEAYGERRHALWNLKTCLREYFGGNQPKAFVFVDELDRCRPDYAVSYLETIKHVFDVRGLVFVLAVDSDHLENSAKSLFGAALNFPEYFRKFVHRSFDLPKQDRQASRIYVHKLIDYYMNNRQNRFTRIDISDAGETIPKLVEMLKMTPRQCIELFRVLGHVATTPTNEQKTMIGGYAFGFMFMTALKVAQGKLYRELGSGLRPHETVLKLFLSILDKDDAYYWALTYFGGYRDKEEAFDQIKTLDLLDQNYTKETLQEQLRKYSGYWGMRSFDRYPQIYEMIERRQIDY